MITQSWEFSRESRERKIIKSKSVNQVENLSALRLFFFNFSKKFFLKKKKKIMIQQNPDIVKILVSRQNFTISGFFTISTPTNLGISQNHHLFGCFPRRRLRDTKNPIPNHQDWLFSERFSGVSRASTYDLPKVKNIFEQKLEKFVIFLSFFPKICQIYFKNSSKNTLLYLHLRILEIFTISNHFTSQKIGQHQNLYYIGILYYIYLYYIGIPLQGFLDPLNVLHFILSC